jgi:lincosamide nucleotidyltransferase A/C/D/E
MTADDAVDVLDRLEAAGVEVWVDGGWGVDALLGVETRPHGDLDVVVRQEQLAAARVALAAAGFSHAADEAPGLPARLVLRDPEGRQVDVHPVEFDEAGDGDRISAMASLGSIPRRV